jgi:CheY-like chemotaxis protein
MSFGLRCNDAYTLLTRNLRKEDKMAKKKILIIDDEEDICEMMKLNLETTGEFEVTTVYSGEKGIETAKEVNFDLIITDFYMPGMDGGEVLNTVKEVNPDLPVLIFSIYHDDESTLAHSIKDKADGIISKPIEHNQLYSEIKKALAKKR